VVTDDVDHSEWIQAGDVFVKRYSTGNETVHVFLARQAPPAAHRFGKRHYMVLSSGGLQSTWNAQRWHLTRRGYRFVGTLPGWFLKELTNEYDW